MANVGPYTREWIEDSFPGGRWVKRGDEDAWLIPSPLRPDSSPSFVLFPSRPDGGGGNAIDEARQEGFKISEVCKKLGIEDAFKGNSASKAAPSPTYPLGDERKAGATLDDIRALWEKSKPATAEHFYIKKKGLPFDDLRVTPGGWLAVPQYSIETGALAGVERIAPHEKRSKDDITKRQYGKRLGGVYTIGDTDDAKTLFVSEGLATGHALHRITGEPVVVVFSSGEFPKRAPALMKRWPDTEIVLCPDCDDAGISSAEKAVGASVLRLPDGLPKGTDWDDVLRDKGPDAAREMLCAAWDNRKVAEGVVTEAEDEAKEAAVVESPATSFALQRLGDIPLVEPRFLVEDLFECDALCLFFGESGCKKSFVAIDLAASIATGAPWNRKQTKEGVVIYLAGEGGGGLPRRARAWEIHRGISLKDAPLYVSNRAALFMDEHGARIVENEVDRIAEMAGSPVLIVVDTIARSMVGGDENSAKDTSIFVERIDALRRRYGASALLIHHSGLSDKGRLRGSSAWKGALEAEYLIEKSGDLVTVTNQKMKDAPEPAPFSFESVEYVVLETATGKEITSLALEPTDEKPARVERISAGQKRALDSFYEAAKANPILDEDGAFLGVHVEDWRGFFYETATAPTQSGKRQAFNRAVKELVEAGHLTVKDDVFSPTSPADTLIVNQNIRKMNFSSQRDSVTERDIVTPCNAADDDPSVTSVTHSYRSVTLSRSPVTLESETGVDVGGKPVLENELGAGLETPEQTPKPSYLELLKGGEHDADTKVS